MESEHIDASHHYQSEHSLMRSSRQTRARSRPFITALAVAVASLCGSGASYASQDGEIHGAKFCFRRWVAGVVPTHPAFHDRVPAAHEGGRWHGKGRVYLGDTEQGMILGDRKFVLTAWGSPQKTSPGETKTPALQLLFNGEEGFSRIAAAGPEFSSHRLPEGKPAIATLDLRKTATSLDGAMDLRGFCPDKLSNGHRAADGRDVQRPCVLRLEINVQPSILGKGHWMSVWLKGLESGSESYSKEFLWLLNELDSRRVAVKLMDAERDLLLPVLSEPINLPTFYALPSAAMRAILGELELGNLSLTRGGKTLQMSVERSFNSAQHAAALATSFQQRQQDHPEEMDLAEIRRAAIEDFVRRDTIEKSRRLQHKKKDD